ncbi:hypothetical protein WJX72_002085 [[Myrmecia] bisecta]|uniref:Dynein regulatory complex protein 10 n=1 Tax=[Myrmecia] bisecta TaxID=41462 RepID=A0AAW1Q2Z0_9CHLO
MNSLEATRVVAVLDEAVDGCRLLSHLTKEVLGNAEHLVDIVGEHVAELLLAHRRAVTAADILGSVSTEELRHSALDLWRALRKLPSAEAGLRSLKGERPAANLQAIAALEKLRHIAYKKLTTTVEEDNSNREHFEEVCRREKKAMKEKLTLEQQLRLDRRERLNQSTMLANAHQKATTELEETKMQASQQKATLEEQASATRDADHAYYASRETQLHQQLDSLKSSYDKLKHDNKEAEAALRKKKAKIDQQVEVWIGKYDEELGAKEQEYQEELSLHRQVTQQLQEIGAEYDRLVGERVTHEEQLAKAAAEKKRADAAARRQAKAATLIQKQWREHKAKKEAEKKKAAAEEKGKKGKKK